MASTPTPNLARLLRRWFARAAISRLADDFAAALIAASLLVAAWLAAGGVQFAAAARFCAWVAGIVIAAIPAVWWIARRLGAPLPWRWAAFAGAAVAATAVVIATSPLDRSIVMFRVAVANLACVLSLILAIEIVPLVRLRRVVAEWLDEQVGAAALLSTASELLANGRGDELSATVIARAESLAGQRRTFAGVSLPRAGVRAWAVLAVVLAGTAVLWFLGPRVTTPRRVDTSQLSQLSIQMQRAGMAGADDLSQAAGELANGGGASAAADRARQQLADHVAAAKPLMQALATIASRAPGEPLSIAVTDATLTADQAADLAARQVQAWRSRELSEADCHELAEQMRQAAAAVEQSDPELARRFRELADALSHRDWAACTERLGEIARRVQSANRRTQLAQAAIAAIDQALSSSAHAPPDHTTPAPPSVAVATTQPNISIPDWPDASDPAQRRMDLDALTPEQREVAKRYFNSAE